MKKKATDLSSVCRVLSEEINSLTHLASGTRHFQAKPLATVAAAEEFQRTIRSVNSSMAKPDFTDFVMGTRDGAYREFEKQIEALSRSVHTTNFDRALITTRTISEVYRRDYEDLARLGLLNQSRPRLRAGTRELLGIKTEADSEARDSELETAIREISEPEPTSMIIVAPRVGETLIGFFSRGTYPEALLGDLAEEFGARAMADGPRRAHAWYWWQVTRSFGPFAWRWARRLLALDDLRQLIGW